MHVSSSSYDICGPYIEVGFRVLAYILLTEDRTFVLTSVLICVPYMCPLYVAGEGRHVSGRSRCIYLSVCFLTKVSLYMSLICGRRERLCQRTRDTQPASLRPPTPVVCSRAGGRQERAHACMYNLSGPPPKKGAHARAACARACARAYRTANEIKKN